MPWLPGSCTYNYLFPSSCGLQVSILLYLHDFVVLFETYATLCLFPCMAL